MRSWSDFISTTLGMHVDYDQFMACTPARLLDLMRRGAVDAVGCTTPEYVPLAACVDPHTLLIDERSGMQEYVLLVHVGSSFRGVADLRGRPLALYRNGATCLALDWVETLLHASNLEPAGRFFAAITQETKLSRAVLPVFFRQTDVCLVTRHGFETMCELNPQLGKTLRVVALSPTLYTAVFAFHRNCPPAINLQFRTALIHLAETTTGKQLLAMFQVSTFATSDSSALRSTLNLIELAREIQRRRAAAKG
jgi:ABC-type phosphate/phosphonate transport system substrate-binding protein